MNQNPEPTSKYKQAKSTMRVLGPTLLAIGVILTIIGFITFISMFANFGSNSPGNGPPLMVFLAFPGILLLGIGGMLTQGGYLKEIAQYGAKETVPAVTTTTTAIRSAIMDNDIPCPSCSSPIEPDSEFCSKCGVQITNLHCPKCNADIESDDRFCSTCGTTIERKRS